MNKLLTAKEMNKADQNTTLLYGMESIILMERAAYSAFQILCETYPDATNIAFFCGHGNNGADGLALARLCHLAGKSVSIYLVGKRESASILFKKQLTILDNYQIPFHDFPEAIDATYASYDLLVDALFGVGINRTIENPFDTAIQFINNRKNLPCISIDLPSGLNTDTGIPMGICVHATVTITFNFYKVGQFLYPGKSYCGKIIMGDAGITKESLPPSVSHFTLLKQDLLSNLPSRSPNGNKGTFGKLLIIAGSESMCGAAILSTKAAFFAGCGMVKVITHKANRDFLLKEIPEAMYTTYDSHTDAATLEEEIHAGFKWADGIIIGPGLSMDRNAILLVKAVITNLDHYQVPVLFDADALNMISADSDLQRLLQKASTPFIFTPHIGELSRLTGKEITSIKNTFEDSLMALTQKYPNLILVGKDASTLCVSAMETTVFVNSTGNSGMATAGSGDVLSGLIGGLFVQKDPDHTLFQKVCIGVAYHGYLGDCAAIKYSEASMTASDIIKKEIDS